MAKTALVIVDMVRDFTDPEARQHRILWKLYRWHMRMEVT